MKYIKLIDKEKDNHFQYQVSDNLFNKVREMCENEDREDEEDMF